MELFNNGRERPLAWRMQPQTLEEFAGQTHILSKGKPLRTAIERDSIVSLILYGPAGTGKTALAHIIAGRTRAYFVSLNAVTSGIAEIKTALKEAKKYALEGRRTILFIDEIHRFNKLQQDALLPDVEAGNVVLIGVSTQNPFFSIIPALSSRSMIFQLFPLKESEIKNLLMRALSDKERGLGRENIIMEAQAADFIAKNSAGDARRALNALELGALILKNSGSSSYDIALAREIMQKKAIYYDEAEHYNTISAFIKSMRGGDPDSALYWMAKMIEAGEDPLFIARRIIICASEDVGNADPQALLIAVAALKAVESIGMPEGRIPLAQAAIYIAMAPKSNASYTAIENALTDVREERLSDVPQHLKDTHYKGASRLGAGAGYKCPHDYDGHFIPQEYMQGHKIFFTPSEEGYEKIFKELLTKRRVAP
ncbi:MAG: replication-associated recombination protein A [Nitrospirae bacterium]|nr:replication-associated recombination protein A [Nitrospirota bacterium]